MLGGIHIKPSDAVEETAYLTEVFDQAKHTFNTNNIIIMGDFNADCSYFPKKAWSDLEIRNNPKFHWLIGDDIDTTVRISTDCAYDR